MSYGYIGNQDYTDLIFKAQSYAKTKKVRSMKAGTPSNTPQHYGIKWGTPLKVDNLLSMSLYTDFTNLCSRFTATFRKIDPFETLSGVKARNRQFWWMSKILRGIVRY